MAPQKHTCCELTDNIMTTIEPDKRDVAHQPRRMRRKPAFEQLGSQDDDTIMPPPANHWHSRSSTWTNTQSEPAALPTSFSALLLLQSTQTGSDKQLGKGRGKQMHEEQSAFWESTLPKPLIDQIGFSATGHHLDCEHPTSMR
jgi:hypothetical protein